MRDTVYCLTGAADENAIEASVQTMVREVQSYVPGYRLKQRVQFERVGPGIKLPFPDVSRDFTGLKVSVFLEVEGAAHYLPAYAGNLDIMTSAALRTAERVALNLRKEIAA
jgi:acetaldehyde dehydrogenase